MESFTQSEIKTLIAHIPQSCEHLDYKRRERREQQLKLLFVLYYGCGLRKSEGLKLTTKDVDFENKTILYDKERNINTELSL
ncbi:tyrosine-type recombinase/integrase [Apibacter mensalis]|uniref:tyrosine-type recombinase/integrase n=1 Tax=Apibacter mensalis TaxID=1586267 RepID=UPI0034E9641C